MLCQVKTRKQLPCSLGVPSLVEKAYMWLVRFWSAIIKHYDQSNLGRKRFISPYGLYKSITEGSQSKDLET